MADSKTSLPHALEIHGSLQLESADLDARLKKLEASPAKESGKSPWMWVLDVLKTLLPSIVLAVLGFALKDSVDQALKEREIQLAAVKEMETLVPDLQKTDLDRVDAEAKAAQLAAYGRYAIPFFVNILEVGNQNAAVGAEDGLRMVARSEPVPVCNALRAVIQNRTGLYRWQTQSSALEVLGQAGCSTVCRDVASFRDGMSSLENYQQWVSLPPLQTEYERVSKQASDTFAQLNRLKPGDCK
ncbi:MAG TPA: hypothetical protein VGN16_04595 [Acidobacteriaceae bacterium]|jgi:hypothetical protein